HETAVVTAGDGASNTVPLDTRGLNCPLPVLRARKVLRTLAAGTHLRLLATDPGTVRDVKAMCEATGDRLIDSSEADGEFVFLIEKVG
ncbi:MAG: sulfurtransferase TusA family protein, partial [Geminicoccaceae bacterium]